MSEVTKHQQSNVTVQRQNSVAERRQDSVDEYRSQDVDESRRLRNAAFECPNCHSGDIQRFPVVYQSGISEVNTRTTGIGMSLSGKIGIGGASTKGHSQTELSRMTAPPPKLKYGIWIVCGFICSFLLAILFEQHLPGKIADILAAICGWGPALFLMVRAFRFNRNVHPQLMRQWENSWICSRCGHTFML